MNLKKIIGIDLSLTSTGVSCQGNMSIVSTKEKGAQRLSIISKQILSICLDNEIECAIIEGYSFASRNSQAHSIGELGGCVRMTLWDAGIPYVDIPPTSRAKFATGRGNASKGEVMSAISAKTSIVFSGSGSDDMCDAWILEQMALAKIGKSEYTWGVSNMSALEKIDWSPLEGTDE